MSPLDNYHCIQNKEVPTETGKPKAGLGTGKATPGLSPWSMELISQTDLQDGKTSVMESNLSQAESSQLKAIYI